MASILQGLFGVDPAQYEQQQAQLADTRALQFAKLDPMQQAQYGIYGGTAAIGRGLLGGEDPILQKATMAKQLATQFDITTPKGLQEYANALAQQGAPDLAQMAIARAQEMMVQNATIGQKAGENINSLISSGKYTPESLAKFQKTRNAGDLELVDKGLTGGALEKVSNAEQNITSLSTGNAEIDSWLKKVDPKAPEVTFGPSSTLGAGVSNLVGSPTQNALEQGKLRRFVAREANAILTAAKGTQTEGDAQRAYDMIMSGLDKNSNDGVYSALEDLKTMKQNTIKGLETYVGSMKTKGKGTSSVAPQAPATGKYADDYQKYLQTVKARNGTPYPYEVYAAKREGK